LARDHATPTIVTRERDDKTEFLLVKGTESEWVGSADVLFS